MSLAMRHAFFALMCFGLSQAWAQTGGPYQRFAEVYTGADANDLKVLSEEFLHAKDHAGKEVYLLASAAHGFRVNDMRRCLETLAGLDDLQPEATPLASAWAHRLRSLVYKRLGDQEQAEEEVRAGLAYLKGGPYQHEYVDMLVVLGEVLRKRGETEASLEALVRAEFLADSLGHAAAKCNVLINRGNLLFDQERYQEAAKLYRQTYALAMEHNKPLVANNAVLNLGATEISMERRDNAIDLYDSLYHALGNGHMQMRAQLRINQALAHAGKGEYVKALLLLDETLPMIEEANDVHGRMKVYQLRSTSEWELGYRDKALRSRMEALRAGQEIGLRDEVARNYMMLSQWHEKSGDPVQALSYLRAFKMVQDSVDEQRFSDRMAVLEVKHETDKKERQLAMRAAELEHERTVRQNRSLQRNLLFGALVFLLVAGYLVYRNMHHRQAIALKEKELSEKRIEEILRSQELRLVNAMAAGQEKERERIARELHDRLGSMLSAIKFQFSAMESMMAELRSEQQQGYEKVLGMIDDAVGVVRRISHDMMRGKLADFGLEDALRDLKESIEVKGRLEVELSVFGLEERLSMNVEMAAYRITQELVSNALKHGRPSELSISFTRTLDRLSLIVSDNGAGFDSSKASDGMGLGNVRSRAAEFKGTVSIDSSPGRGTSVIVEIPLSDR